MEEKELCLYNPTHISSDKKKKNYIIKERERNIKKNKYREIDIILKYKSVTVHFLKVPSIFNYWSCKNG